MHVAVAGYGRKREAANEFQRCARRNGGGERRGDVVRGGSLIFTGRIDAEDLSEILDVNACSVGAAIETPDQKHAAVRQRVEVFRNALKIGFPDQFPFGHIHTNRSGKRESRKFVFGNTGKCSRWEFGDVLTLTIAERNRKAGALASVFHNRQFHLHAGEREPRFRTLKRQRMLRACRALPCHDTHRARQIPAKCREQVEIIARANLAGMMFLHGFAQPVFRQQVREKSRERV